MNRHSFFSWLRFLFFYTLKRKSIWFIFFILTFAGFFTNFSSNSQKVIRVGIYCEAPDNMTSLIFSQLEASNDGLYYFYQSPSISYLHEDVALRKAECGYIFPDNLEKCLQNNVDDCIQVCISSGTVLTDVINEVIFNAVFKEYSKLMLADYISSDDVVNEAFDNIISLVDEYFSYEYENSSVFHVVYEDVPDSFYDDQALFRFPLRGLCIIMIFLSSIAGSSQFKHDQKKCRFLLRRRGEHFAVSFIYCLLPALFIACASFVSMLLGSVILDGSLVFAELLLLVVFSVLCATFSTFYGAIIKNTIVSDALMPAIALFCILYSPILADLSDYMPNAAILSWLAPTQWYFSIFNLIS